MSRNKKVNEGEKGKRETPNKTPRSDPNIQISDMQKKPTWRIECIDLDGPFGWKNIERKEFFNFILPKLKEIENKYWSEISISGKKYYHQVGIDVISKEAKNRLRQLQLDENPKLLSLHLSSKKRIWGIKIGNVIKVLWWDPEHKVYPTQPRNT